MFKQFVFALLPCGKIIQATIPLNTDLEEFIEDGELTITCGGRQVIIEPGHLFRNQSDAQQVYEEIYGNPEGMDDDQQDRNPSH